MYKSPDANYPGTFYSTAATGSNVLQPSARQNRKTLPSTLRNALQHADAMLIESRFFPMQKTAQG